MGNVGSILAVTGTKREAAVLRGLGVEIAAIAGSAEALDGALVATGGALAAIISFGMAGALSPDLGLGDWVIGTGLAGGADCDAEWSNALAAKLPTATFGLIYADGQLVADPAKKRALYHSTGAIAADMESHFVAAAAVRLGVPFAVLRCVSDDAASALPPAIAVAMKPDGGLALGAILKSILGNPLQLPDLLTTSLRFNRAYLDMEAGAKLVGPRLAYK